MTRANIRRVDRLLTMVAITATMASAPYASLAEDNLGQASGPASTATLSEPPALVSADPIRLDASTDLTPRSDIFGQVRSFDAPANFVELQNGLYASWSYKFAEGESYPTVLAGVKTGATPRDVGILSYSGPARAVQVPAAVPCDVIDTHGLGEIPRSPFKYIAACRIHSEKGQTELVLFNADGQHRTLGFHPWAVTQINTRPGVHGGAGALSMMITSPGPDKKIYLQMYTWDPR